MNLPKPAHAWRSIAGAALISVGILAAAPAAQAQHLQGGSFTAAITADGHLKGTLTYLERIGCGSGGVGSQKALPGGSITSPTAESVSETFMGTATVCRTSESVYEAPFDFTLSSEFSNGTPDGDYTVAWRQGNRVAGIANFANSNSGYVKLEARVHRVAGHATSAPVLGSNAQTGISPVRQDPQSLNASDPDGGTLTYRTALKVPGAGSTSIADSDAADSDVVALDTHGILTIPTASSMTPGAFYTYKVRVTDTQGDFADRDVLMTVAPAGQAPPNITGLASQYAVTPGQVRTITFSADDTSTSPNNVTLSPAGLPSWATLTQTTGNPATATLRLAPPANLAATTARVNLDATTVAQPPLTSSKTVTVVVRAASHAAAPAPAATTAPAPAATRVAAVKAAILAPTSGTTFAAKAGAKGQTVALPIACPSVAGCTVTGTMSTTEGELFGSPRKAAKRRHYFGRFVHVHVDADGKQVVTVTLSKRFLRSARRHHRKTVTAQVKLITTLPSGAVVATRKAVTVKLAG